MGGGLMQLVAYGAQDIYLTGNPQITFFKVVYRRHTNFSMESIKQTFNGTPDFGADVTATISRNGDLVYRMYLEHDLSFKATAADDTLAVGPDYGSHLMKEIKRPKNRFDKRFDKRCQGKICQMIFLRKNSLRMQCSLKNILGQLKRLW